MLNFGKRVKEGKANLIIKKCLRLCIAVLIKKMVTCILQEVDLVKYTYGAVMKLYPSNCNTKEKSKQ